MMRFVLVGFACVVLTIALSSNSSIYMLVVNTYKVTLVAAFVPLCAGLFWSKATTQGAHCAIVAGLTTWIECEFFGSADSVWPPQLVGFLMAIAGMVIGSLLPPLGGSPLMRPIVETSSPVGAHAMPLTTIPRQK
jgi:solute:Na+ symporter, SSS family